MWWWSIGRQTLTGRSLLRPFHSQAAGPAVGGWVSRVAMGRVTTEWDQRFQFHVPLAHRKMLSHTIYHERFETFVSAISRHPLPLTAVCERPQVAWDVQSRWSCGIMSKRYLPSHMLCNIQLERHMMSIVWLPQSRCGHWLSLCQTESPESSLLIVLNKSQFYGSYHKLYWH